MKDLLRWLHAHPLKAVGFTALLTALFSFAGNNGHLFWHCMALVTLVTLFVLFVIWRDNKALVLILVAALAFPVAGNAKEQEPPELGGLGCAVVVVIVGGVVVYGLNKFCQKKFAPPPKTNTTAVAYGAAGSAAASHNYSSCGSCYTPAYMQALASGAPTVTFEIIGLVSEDELQQPLVLIESAALAPVQTNTVDWAGYVTAVQAHGITVTEHGQGEKYYAIDGVPCTADECPVSFNDRVINVTNGSPMGRVIVERSEDLQNWTTVLETWVSQGYRFKFVDTSIVQQAFYRVTR
jgi:hypothetical protein